MVATLPLTSCSLPRRRLVTSSARSQHGDVLLHGGEAHRVAVRERRHGVLALEHAHDDVASGGVRECVEHPVGLLLGQLIYNHLVVD